MRMEAKKESKDLSECRNKSFKFLKKMKRKGKDVESGKYIQDFMEDWLLKTFTEKEYGNNL